VAFAVNRDDSGAVLGLSKRPADDLGLSSVFGAPNSD